MRDAIHPKSQPWWTWLNTLALDAPLLAVLWQLFLARCFRIHLAIADPLVLGLCCWLIYACDYLLDASEPSRTLPARHKFFRRHKRALAIIAGAMAAAAIILAAKLLNARTLRLGLFTSALVCLYLLLVHASPRTWRRSWPREMVVACLFAVGAVLSLWTHAGSPHGRIAFAGLVFAVLCWTNCALIEHWEWKKGSSSSAPSTSAFWLASKMHGVSALASAGTLLVFSLMRLPFPFTVAAGLSGVGLQLLGNGADDLSADAFRVLADAVLYTPALLFPLLGHR